MSCKKNSLPVIEPVLRTELIPHDTDDPAIWVNISNPENSIVFGTDKDEINGGVYAFNLDGKIIKGKSITNISYPNNVDVAYNFKLNDSTKTDVLAFTERGKNQIRLFSVPDMKMLDNGGFKVFEDETDIAFKRPMGIAFYTDVKTESTYVIVSRKEGSKTNYLYQYAIECDSTGIQSKLVRKFGAFSGKKEIEAIAVDEELGFVYYSDEGHCVRKYYANPDKGNEEIACFGADYFRDDIEGIAIVKYENNSGFLVVSDQQNHSFSIFDRNTNAFIKAINLGTVETDGCEVTTVNLGSKFPNGLFVSMTDSKEFLFHELGNLNLSKD
ncbi:phytase [Ichthyenterobacterium sp. W332]|uniref:Phytase n=1 Tax=Microcosmobacter mediterraneus TaxID=3075607 RepID=A0ABU2YJ84_9FLAO|nr:phytase [Ichthyenterobacterium sp. W332]MDT0558234.1 phytase [Ichthyenterobacterium sp. W332]